MMYDPAMVQPMRDELTNAGVKELLTVADVDQFFEDKSDTSLLIVNSVCGCAAGSARPGLLKSLENGKKPNRVATVFAGMEKDATQQARGYFSQMPPSSPSIVVLKQGEIVHFVPRHMIEGRLAEEVAAELTKVYDEHF